MRRTCNVLVLAVAAWCAVVVAAPAHAYCTLDHFLVGQQGGALWVDDWQVYRHWKEDYAEPYAEAYYELMDWRLMLGCWGRTEPGFGEVIDGVHDLSLVGTPGVDYDVCVERLYATPGLEMYDDNFNPLLEADGDDFALSAGYINHHVHMKYVVWDDPTAHYEVRYRLVDSLGNLAPSAPFSVHFGAPAPEPATLGLIVAGGLSVLLGRRRSA